MAAERFIKQLAEQIGNEFGACQQYIASAVFYDAQTLPQLAAFFYRQAREEHNHAMMMVQYLLDVGAEFQVPGVAAPKTNFADILEPVAHALEQERQVGEQINGLAALARAENDYASEQFMQWFVKEQVEEVASMSDLLTVVARSRDLPLEIEAYIAREKPGGDEDPSAPTVAGGAC